MTNYREYTKGGEIFIAPSPNYKDSYLIQCSVCEEYHNHFETFISHHLCHYNFETNGRESSPSGALSELFNDIEEDDSREEIDGSIITPTSEELDSNKMLQKCPQNKTESKWSATNSNKMDDVGDKALHAEAATNGTEDLNLEKPNSDAKSYEEHTELETPKSNPSVLNFIKSKENVIKLIAAYKNQPKLWNSALPAQLRVKAECAKCLRQIATELRDNADIKMTYKQLAEVIVHLRQNYRASLHREESSERKETTKTKSMWFCKYLGFLKPFLEKNPIAVLCDYQQELTSKQIVLLLDNYKRCPCLWNTNLMEYYCSNKRSEAIRQMLSITKLEMGLEVSENALEKYLHSVNLYFSREKRRNMGIDNASKEAKSQYYEFMKFLYDHVGPFKCSECNRNFNSPLHLKLHMSGHNRTISLKCSLCNKEFKKVEAYIYHVRRHMNDLNEECAECGKKFLKVVELKSHLRFHTGAKPYCCEVCGRSFRHAQAFTVHKRSHGKKYKYYCPTCSKGFYTKNHMEVHKKTHNGQRTFACPTCGKAFKTKRTMQQHEFTHEKGMKHICHICEKPFKNKINLNQHTKIHARNGARDPTLKSKLNTFLET